MENIRTLRLANCESLQKTNLLAFELALEELKTALGPAYIEEDAEIRMQLTHDRGMRLREIVMQETFGLRSNVLYRVTDTISYRKDAISHVLTVNGVVLSWPTRVIALGNGNFNYL